MAGEPEYLDPEDEERSQEILLPETSALAILNQSEHAAMVATANLKGNRRSIDEFSKKLMQYATHSQEVALSMFYTLPRANKQIVGPSVRFAEIVAPCWKNNSTGSRMIGETDKTVTAQGVFIDYESNNKNVKEIPRRITSSDGRKFGDDMILTTSKAALSIAYREAILKGGVPQALYNPAYNESKQTAVGKAISHTQRVDLAMEYLNKLGVTEWQIMNAVGCTSPKDLEVDHLVTLRVMCDEIKRGERSIEDVFGSPFDKEIDALFTQLGKNATEQRMLRTSYRGRAKELVGYLRERIAPTGQGTPAATTATEAAAKETQKAKAGRPPKRTAADEKPAEEKTSPETKPEEQAPHAEVAGNAAPESGKFEF